MILGLKRRKFKLISKYLDQEMNNVFKEQKDMITRLKCFLMFKPGATVLTKNETVILDIALQFCFYKIGITFAKLVLTFLHKFSTTSNFKINNSNNVFSLIKTRIYSLEN